MENNSRTKIYSKLLEFQKKINAIKKDGKNPHFKSTYATLSQMLSEVKPVLSDCNLVLTQAINEFGVASVVIDPETEEQIESSIPLPINLSPQQLGSAITYFRRYTLASLLSLEVEDDDANGAVKQVKNAVGEIPLSCATVGSPLIEGKLKLTDLAMSKAIDRIKAGEYDLINKLIKTFDLTEPQRDSLLGLDEVFKN